MSDLDSILSDDEPQEVETLQEEEAERPETPEQAEAPQEEPAREPEKEPEQAMVPLAALQEARGEAKELRALLAQTQQAQTEQQAQANQPKPPEFLDPDGAAFIQNHMQMMQMNFNAELSEAKARIKYGSEQIDAAIAAAEEAGVVDRFRGQPDAWGKLGEWHMGVQEQKKAQALLSEIGGDVDAFKAKIREEIMGEIKAEQVAQSVSQVTAPSLAGEPNLGSRAAPKWSGPTSLDDILGG